MKQAVSDALDREIYCHFHSLNFGSQCQTCNCKVKDNRRNKQKNIDLLTVGIFTDNRPWMMPVHCKILSKS